MGKKNQLGMSLIELMVALFVVTTVFAGVYGMSAQVSSLLSQARGETRAVEAAQFEIERLRSMSWTALTNLGSSYTISDRINTALADVQQGAGTVTVGAYPPASSAPTVYSVNVNIAWKDAYGVAKNMNLTTLIAQQGMNL